MQCMDLIGLLIQTNQLKKNSFETIGRIKYRLLYVTKELLFILLAVIKILKLCLKIFTC